MVKKTARALRKSQRFITAFAVLALLSSVFAPTVSANESAGSDETAFTGIDVSAISIEETEIDAKAVEWDETVILNGIPSNGTSVGVDIETFNALPQFSISGFSGLALFSAADGLNDDPNYAYWLNPNTGYQESLSPQGASRWFATQISAAAKLTTLLDMPSGVDFDLQIYKLNGSTLNMVGAASAGAGVREVSKYMAAAGTYYIRVLSYSGTGTFQLYNLAAYGYDSYELNDTAATATQLGSLVTSANVTATGNIDDYYDEDYYQVTVPSGTSYLIFILAAENPNYSLYSGNELLQIGSPVTVSASATATSIPLRVVSSDQSFDENEPYTLSVQKLPASYDPSLYLLITTPDNSITVQYNNDAREEVYINGHLITWWFHDSIEFPKNSEGSIARQVTFSQKAAVGPYDPEPVEPVFGPRNGSMFSPIPIYYTSTHRDAEGELKFMITVENCSVVNWNDGNGEYALIDTGSTADKATLIVNPETGHIFDVLSPNIIYQYSGGTVDVVEMTSHWYFAPPPPPFS